MEDQRLYWLLQDCHASLLRLTLTAAPVGWGHGAAFRSDLLAAVCGEAGEAAPPPRPRALLFAPERGHLEAGQVAPCVAALRDGPWSTSLWDDFSKRLLDGDLYALVLRSVLRLGLRDMYSTMEAVGGARGGPGADPWQRVRRAAAAVTACMAQFRRTGWRATWAAPLRPRRWRPGSGRQSGAQPRGRRGARRGAASSRPPGPSSLPRDGGASHPPAGGAEFGNGGGRRGGRRSRGPRAEGARAIVPLRCRPGG